MKRLWSKTEIEGVAKESSKQLYRHNILVKGKSNMNTASFGARLTIIDDQAVGYTTTTKLGDKLKDIGETEASGGITFNADTTTSYPIFSATVDATYAPAFGYWNNGALCTTYLSGATVVDVVKAI